MVPVYNEAPHLKNPKAYRGDLTKPLLLYGGPHRFIPVLSGLHSALLLIAGMVYIGIGLCAEPVVRTCYESSGKRIYTVHEVLA